MNEATDLKSLSQGWNCVVVCIATTCDSDITNGHWLVLHFWVNSLRKAVKDGPMFWSLPLTWETWLACNFALAQPWHLWPLRGWKILSSSLPHLLSLSLSLPFSLIASLPPSPSSSLSLSLSASLSDSHKWMNEFLKWKISLLFFFSLKLCLSNEN